LADRRENRTEVLAVSRAGQPFIEPDRLVGSLSRLKQMTKIEAWFCANSGCRTAKEQLKMINLSKNKHETGRSAFTLIEIIVVMVILSIVALLAVPMLSSAADTQVRAAANMIAADLEYAKSMAIGRQQNYSVVFDVSNDSYQICDSGGTVIAHPVKVGFTFVIDFPGDSRLNRVDIAVADFDASQTITFDYLGSPYSAAGTANPLNNGQITLAAGNFTMIITVQPVTGYIIIQ